jgi:hypothetical protein
MAMIGMQPVSLPGVVTKYNARSQLTDDECNPASLFESAVELAIDVFEESDLAGVVAAQPLSGIALFGLTANSKCGHVSVGIPRPLGSVRTHEMMDRAAVSGPFGEEPAAPEFDVVRMSPDGES